MERIKFSIIIPVYNAEKYLEECINSVLNQTYQELEIILINDGSKDNSSKICEEYSKNIKVKVLHNKNNGAMLSRIEGIENSTGEYLIFLDSDDYLELNTLEELEKIIEKKSTDMVLFRYRRVDDNKNIILNQKQIFKNNEVITKKNKKEILKIMTEKDDLNNLCNKVIKKELITKDIIKNKENYNIRHGEDLLFSLDLVIQAKSILYINNIFYNYRFNENSVTNSFNVEMYKNINYIYKVVKKKSKEFKLNNNNSILENRIQGLIRYIFKLYSYSFKKEIKNKINIEIKELDIYNDYMNTKKDISLPNKNIIVLYLFKNNQELLLNYSSRLFYILSQRRNRWKKNLKQKNRNFNF